MLTVRQGVRELLTEHLIRWGTAKDICWGEAVRLAAVEEARRQAAAMRIQGMLRRKLSEHRMAEVHAAAARIQSVCTMYVT
jgi:hypothetical protein